MRVLKDYLQIIGVLSVVTLGLLAGLSMVIAERDAVEVKLVRSLSISCGAGSDCYADHSPQCEAKEWGDEIAR